MLLYLSVTATTRVFWITPSGVVLTGSGNIYLGDTLAWANITGHAYSVSGHSSPSSDYPFSCTGLGPCKYVPPVLGNYSFYCNSLDYTSFSGSFTVINPTAIIETPTKQALLLFNPNPAIDVLHFTGNGKCSVSLYDLLGNNVAQYSFHDNGTMDISALPAGTYIVSANTESQHTTQRIVITK